MGPFAELTHDQGEGHPRSVVSEITTGDREDVPDPRRSNEKPRDLKDPGAHSRRRRDLNPRGA